MWRRLLLIPATVLLMGMMATAAMAKTPPFELVVSAETVEPGETVTVEVTLDQEFPAEDLNGLLGLFRIAGVDDDLRPTNPYGFTPVALPQVGEGVYRGTFEAPLEPGEYVLVPFPNVVENYPEDVGYPDPQVLSVQHPGSAEFLLPASVTVVAAVGALGLISAFRGWRQQAST